MTALSLAWVHTLSTVELNFGSSTDSRLRLPSDGTARELCVLLSPINPPGLEQRLDVRFGPEWQGDSVVSVRDELLGTVLYEKECTVRPLAEREGVGGGCRDYWKFECVQRSPARLCVVGASPNDVMLLGYQTEKGVGRFVATVATAAFAALWGCMLLLRRHLSVQRLWAIPAALVLLSLRLHVAPSWQTSGVAVGCYDAVRWLGTFGAGAGVGGGGLFLVLLAFLHPYVERRVWVPASLLLLLLFSALVLALGSVS
jgi:hypothetical protein